MVSRTKLANEFPKDWEIRKLYEIGSTYSGLTNKNKEDFENGNSKFITYKNIYNNTFIDINELESVRINPGEKQNEVKYGDVFFTGSSETPDEVGISSVLLEDIKNVYLNSFCFGFRFNDINLTIPEFYGYYFRGPIFRREVYPLAQGSTRFNLSKSELIKLKIPIPPVPEQRKIAAILSSVDEAIEKTEAIIEQTEKVKKGLMQQLLTKGIGHTKFKKTEIGEIPEEWRIVKLSDILKIKHGFAFKSEHFVNSGSYLLLTPGNFKANGGLQLKGEKEKYYNGEFPKEFLLKQGDLLIVLTDLTPECKILGSPAIIPEDNKYLHNQRLGKVVNLDDNRVKKSFLFYFMNSYRYRNHLRNTATGTTVRHTSPDKIYDVSMALPSIEEQEKIVKVLSSFDMRIEKEHKKLEILLAVKKGLMQSLLTGKVRVKVDDEVVSS